MTVPKQRLFFALWSPAAVRERLGVLVQAAARRAEARPTRPETLHLTLVFLGNCRTDQVAALCAGAAACRVEPFMLAFDQLGCWKTKGIVWLAPQLPAPELLALEQRLRQLALGLGLELDRRPYAPHLTLARKARLPFPAQALEALRWPVEDFRLIESRLTPAGPTYHELARWPLLS
ncbi:MAG: RNA 2',3'-cyclic phosphodiesterase [Betaproteobacteria bacterium]|nr:RNA 2',3'-cyclic phosphodiesterase [Betaproteobacteria bacterium]